MDPEGPSSTSDGARGCDPQPCPALEILEAVAIGAACDAAVATHVDSCDRCRTAVMEARRDNQFLAEVGATRRTSSATTAPGGSVGPAGAVARGDGVPGYELHGELHRGAQGVVHEAIQRSTHRRVALKLMVHGRFSTSAERRRFEREIEVVGGLRHPGIVTLYDSGTTPDGAAFFAMELVEGVRFDEWLAAPPRPLAERLRVLRAIADAVGHAHRRGVIHRDLKPGNVLVASDGTPRVLDFGLARWSDAGHALRGRRADATVDGGFAGTFAYAAPEQLTGPADQIDVRADIYALGLLLHETLTGERTFGADEPPAAAIARRLAGPAPDEPLRRAGVEEDLRAIVRHATAPDPARRYQSAAALVDDLDRFAARRPVAARGDSTAYVLRRFAGRHRGAVAFAAMTALVALGAAIVAASLLYQRDRQQRRAQGTLEALHDTLVAMSERAGGDGAAGGEPTTAAEFFAGVAERVDKRLGDDPQGRAFVHATFGEIDVNLADLDGAERHFSTVLESLDPRSRDNAPAIAAALHGLGRVAFYRGDIVRAETHYRDALARREALFGRRSAEFAATLSHIGSCRRRQHDLAGADTLFREVLRIREELGGPTPEDFAAAINNLGSLRLEAGDVDEALALYERAHEMMVDAVGPDDWRVAHALRNVGGAMLAQCRADDATAPLRRAVQIWDHAAEKGHPRRLAAHLDLARCRLEAGDVDEAERLVAAIAPQCGEPAHQHQEFREALARFTTACQAAGHPELADVPGLRR